MKDKTIIEPGEHVLIAGGIWAKVEEVIEDSTGETFLVCVDDIDGEEHRVDPESVLRPKDL
jgi:preprotein translocase subunit YajC